MSNTQALEIGAGVRVTLALPKDLAELLKVHKAHDRGYKGKDVRVVLIDSGFDAKHAWFSDHATNARLALDDSDPHGHGTMNAAMVLSVAPEAELFGLGLSSEAGALALLEKAIDLNPKVIVLPFIFAGSTDGPSWSPDCANDPADDQTKRYLELVERASADGIVVIAAAGDMGAYSATASAPSVISVGGVTTGGKGEFAPSWQTAHFASKRFPIGLGTYVPEVCGLCGSGQNASYFRVPTPKDPSGYTATEILCDATSGSCYRNDWGGSGAAAAQVAGVAALVLSKNPGATPAEVRTILRHSCRFVYSGLPPIFVKERPAHDPITGFGLIDAAAAVGV